MKAIAYDGRVRYREDAPAPRPQPGEALIRVELAGICRTDVEVARGYLAFRGVMGHEFVGTVVQAHPSPAAPDAETWLGRRVVGEINLPCRSCPDCEAGLFNHCRRRSVLGIDGRDGVFAEFVALPAANLHLVPEGLADRDAVFTEPLAACYQVLEQVPEAAGADALVLGDGKMGLLMAQVLAARGGQVTLVGKHHEKMALLEGVPAGGRVERISLEELDTRRGRQEGGWPLVVECTGRPEGFQTALAMVRPCGVVALKSTIAAGYDVNLAPIVINEVRVVGSRCGPFSKALAALAAGEVSVAPLISRETTLRAGVAELLAPPGGGHVKTLLRPN